MAAPEFDVVAVVGSAGGVEPLTDILRGLGPEFPAPVVVVQHLPDEGRALASILRRRVRLPVMWAVEGHKLEAGFVLLCPPATGLVVLPDGTLSVVAPVQPQDRPFDMLLESLAETHPSRTLAVVLAGGGRDGAAGARAVTAAGGMVVAEESPLPSAAVAAGAVDLVLPREEIAALLLDLVGHGARPPTLPDEAGAMARVFVGDTPAAAHLRAVDWPSSPLGAVATWPASLGAAVRTMLDHPLPVIVHWGPDLIVLPNDASRALLGAEFARVAGRPLGEAWPANLPAHLDVLETGRPRVVEDAPFLVDGREVFLTTALTVLRGDQGGLAGTMSTAVDTTGRVLGRRQDDILHRLQVGASGATTLVEAAERAVAVLASDVGLVPFALVYLLDGPRRRAQLAAATGLEAGGPAAPRTMTLADDDEVWPVDAVTHQASAVVVGGPVPALVLPLRLGRDERAAGVVVLGVSPGRPLDPVHRAFLDDVGGRVAAVLAEARSRQQEQARLDTAAEADRAKTEFFADVSHEFRTPLTLLLGPLEAALTQAGDLPPAVAADLDLAHRSALRLLRMVQSLLDFSQAETGRRRGSFGPTDLSALTRDVVGVFRGAADAAGLQLVVDCPPLPETVWVDPVMWERIVSNLLSNALKFTLRGGITVSLRLLPLHAELVVVDTGSGIPEADVPHVFERFHRAEGVPARTREGTGIGLALVDDLVRLHHGRVRVQSRLGEGSTFTVWIPRGRRLELGLPDPGAAAGAADRLALAQAHADEALTWSTTAGDAADPDRRQPVVAPVNARWGRILVVDDNSDLRAYLRRLLARHWEVDVAADGIEARARIAGARPPDLVVADVMMPEVDGLELLSHLRGEVPVILLSARAGEDDVVAGLEAGADDYIVKPFSSRELVARVGALLELTRLRRQRDQAVRIGDDRLQLALGTSGFVAFELDTVTGEVTVLGGDPSVLEGVDEDDLAQHLAALDPSSARTEPLDTAGGGVRWIRSVAHRLPDAPGRLFGVSTDVTTRHQVEERLAEATRQLQSDIDVMVRYQALSSRLAVRPPSEPIESLLTDILDAVVELHRADGGAIELYDPETTRPGTIWPAAFVTRGTPPDGADAEPVELVDATGEAVGAITISSRRLARSDLERRLAELYLRQAVTAMTSVKFATRSGAGAGRPGVASEEAAEEAADQTGGEEAADPAPADAEEVGVDGLDLADDDGGVGPDGGEVGR